MDEQQASTAFNRMIGQNLQNLRKAAGLSQADLAQELTWRGLPFQQQTVLKVEKGARPLKLEEAVQAADAIGVTVQQLVEFSSGLYAAVVAHYAEQERAAKVQELKRQLAELEGDDGQR